MTQPTTPTSPLNKQLGWRTIALLTAIVLPYIGPLAYMMLTGQVDSTDLAPIGWAVGGIGALATLGYGYSKRSSGRRFQYMNDPFHSNNLGGDDEPFLPL